MSDYKPTPPTKKVPKEERRARRWDVQELLAVGQPPHRIISQITETYGVSGAQVYKDISYAKREMEKLLRHDLDKERQKEIAMADVIYRRAIAADEFSAAVSALRVRSSITGTSSTQRASGKALSHLAEVAAAAMGGAAGATFASNGASHHADPVEAEPRVVDITPTTKSRFDIEEAPEEPAVDPDVLTDHDVHLPPTMEAVDAVEPPAEIEVRDKGSEPVVEERSKETRGPIFVRADDA